MNAVDVDNLVAVPSMDDDGMGHQRSTSNDYNDDVQRFSSSRDLPLGQTDDSQFANSNPNSPDERAPPEESDSPQYASSNYGYDNFANYPNSYGSSEFQTPGAFSSADLRHSGGGGSVDMDNNLQRPIMTDARMNRIALAEAAMREEMFKECTFRPKIKNLPSHYGPMKEASTPFQTRVVKWQKEKELAAKAKKEMISSGEKVECTFNPKINRNSDKAIKEIRGPEYSESANDRLYRNSGLYLQQRAQLIDESKEKQDEKIKADCTFRPELVTKRSEVHKSVMPKYATHATKAVQPDTDSDAGNRKNCTFTPKVNKIKPNMSSAKLYLSTNVVDRLTRPIGGGGVSEEKGADGAGAGGGSSGNLNQLFDNELSTHDRPVMDMASFMGNLQQQQQRPHSAGGRPQRSSSAPRGSKTSTMTPEEREERKRQFEMFLSRQQTVLKRKEDNVKQIDKALTPNFKPSISRRAQAKGGSISFVERVDREIQRRKAQEQAMVTANPDGECTFQPKLSKKVAKLPGRSVVEMSVGDALKKKNALMKLKMQANQEELADATFKPQLTEYAKKSKSVLQLDAEPGQFLDWYREATLKKEHKRVAMLREKDEAEQVECTFTPTTRPCPTYVKRIAKSMAIVKAARNSAGSFVDANADKPEWR